MKKYQALFAAFAVAFVVVDVLLRVTGVSGNAPDKAPSNQPSDDQPDQKNQQEWDNTKGQASPQGGLSQPNKTDNAIPVNQDGGNNEGYTNEAATGNTD